MEIVYYLATSLDGFIADADGGVGWLDMLNIDHQDSDYESFFRSVDGLLMGRKTFDFVYDYGQWPYENRPSWVCSHRDVPAMEGCNLQEARDPKAAIEQAKRQGLSTLWLVGGGELARVLLEARLLTHLSVSVMPVLLGDGVRLVQSLPAHVFLQQKSATTRAGYTQIEYRVKTKSQPGRSSD